MIVLCPGATRKTLKGTGFVTKGLQSDRDVVEIFKVILGDGRTAELNFALPG